jgi:hypothetical protein
MADQLKYTEQTVMERKGGKEAMKNYKPRRTPGSLDDVVTSETRAKMEAAKAEVADQKMGEAQKDAYNKASGMKNGGSASSRADGIASRGKTRGMMC